MQLALQTFWTKPLRHDRDRLRKLFTPQFLSCLTMSNFYELIIYGRGLICQMGIPYSKVIAGLNLLEDWSLALWSILKYSTYKLFEDADHIHFDLDVALEREFRHNYAMVELNEALLYQEHVHLILDKTQALVGKYGIDLPIAIDKNTPYCYNVGTIGIKDKVIRKQYISLCDDFLGRNSTKLSKIEKDGHDVGIFLSYIEQYCLPHFLDNDQVTLVFDENYLEAHEHQYSFQRRPRRDLERETGIGSRHIDEDFFPHDLLRIPDLRYVHYVASPKYNDSIFKPTEFYFDRYYPEWWGKMQRFLINNIFFWEELSTT